MLNQPLDRMFQALVDPSRRSMLERLSCGPASVSQLAELFAMSLPATVQDIQVLEHFGLLTSRKTGRIRTSQLEPGALQSAEQWLHDRRLVGMVPEPSAVGKMPSD